MTDEQKKRAREAYRLHQVNTTEEEKKRSHAALIELVRLSEELGLYDIENETHETKT